MHGVSRKSYRWTPEMLAALTHAYRSAASRKQLMAAITHMVRLTGFPRHVILHRAQLDRLALSTRHPWTPAEIARLRDLVGSYPAWRIAEIMKRTRVSIDSQFYRMQLSSRLSDGYSVSDIAACFGVTSKTVDRWISARWLDARGGPGQGRIPEAAVARFIKQHPEEYRLNRVDEAWFKGLAFPLFGISKRSTMIACGREERASA
jgi:hypothetical protein